MASSVLVALFFIGFLAMSHGFVMERLEPVENAQKGLDPYFFKKMVKRQISVNFFNPRDYYMDQNLDADKPEFEKITV